MILYIIEYLNSADLSSSPTGLRPCSGNKYTVNVQFQRKLPKLRHCALHSLLSLVWWRSRPPLWFAKTPSNVFEKPTKQNLRKKHDLHQKSPFWYSKICSYFSNSYISSTISLILPGGPAAATPCPFFIRVCLDLIFQVTSPNSACQSWQASFLFAGLEILNHVWYICFLSFNGKSPS